MEKTVATFGPTFLYLESHSDTVRSCSVECHDAADELDGRPFVMYHEGGCVPFELELVRRLMLSDTHRGTWGRVCAWVCDS